MARSIKWRIQFKSENETGCLINIYEEGYTSSADTTKTGNDIPLSEESGVSFITPASDPINIKESDTTNMLSLIRYKTGYLNVIEETEGQLNDFPPSSIMAHYVEAYYGNTLMFTGYMQCQEFENGWEATPRKLSFPIISPLGLAESLNFTPPASTGEPGITTMGALMKEVIDGLRANYQTVIYPRIVTDNTFKWHPWSASIRTLAVCPYNTSFKHYYLNINDWWAYLWEPISYKSFLHGICANYGWMLHDTPTELVFDKFNTLYKWSSIPVANLTNGNNITSPIDGTDVSVNLHDTYTYRDNNATISIKRPLKSLKAQIYVGAEMEVSINGEYAKTSDRNVSTDSITLVLKQIGPEVKHDHMVEPYATKDGFNLYGFTPIAYGKTDQQTGQNIYTDISVSPAYALKYNTAFSNNGFAHLITVTYYGALRKDASYRKIILSFTLERGSDLKNMRPANLPLTLNDNTYVYGWADTNGLYRIPLTGVGTFDITTFRLNILTTLGNLSNGDYIKISDIRISNNYPNITDYICPPGETVFNGPSNGIGEESISLEVNGAYADICTEGFKTIAASAFEGNSKTLAYDDIKHVFYPITAIKAKFLYTGLQYAPHDYIYLYNWNQRTGLWKILAKSFNFKKGLHELTIINTQTFIL